MSARAAKILLLATVAGWACQREVPPAPALTKVEPSASRGFEATPVRLLGGPFARRIRVDLDAPQESREAASFSAALVSGGLRVPLNEVAFVSETELSAVVPGGVAGGSFDVELVDPWGRKAALPGGFAVAPECLVPSDCDDGLPCTIDDCVGYLCVRTVAAGQCAVEGACYAEGDLQPDVPCHGCVPPASQETWSPLPNGTPCEDGDLCTLGETCQLGACGEPTGAVSCPATACLDNHCDPATGQCVPSERSGPCEDGYDCTAGDACQGGECRGTPVCGNTAPMPCFEVRPKAARAPATVAVDPSCSFDLEDPRPLLRARWDLDGDGLFDTAYLPLSPPPQVTFATAGVYRISMELVDLGGLTAATARDVSVATAAEDLVVTTRFDESDPVADPRYPGGTGLSLREAIQYANGAGIPLAIRFLGPMQIAPTSVLPSLNKAGARIVGQPGVTIDFSLVTGNSPCLTLNGAGQRLIGIEARSCPATMLTFTTGATQASVSESSFDGGLGTGISVSGDNAQVGPRVVVDGFLGNGVELKKTGEVVYESTIRGNALSGIDVFQAPSSVILKDVVARNGRDGILIRGNQSNTHVWNNTLHGNGIDAGSNGISAATTTQGIDARDNLLTSNGGFALCGTANSFAAEDPNGMYANAQGAYCTGAPDGGSFVADAGYLAPDRGDFRLRPDSPAVNAGAVLDPALDLNGISDGGWNATFPDLGAWESPY